MSGDLGEEALPAEEPHLQGTPEGLQRPIDDLEEDSGGQGQSPGGVELQQMAEIVERKREKKSIQRLDLQIGKPTEPLKIEEGRGIKLGVIEHVAYYIGRTKADELKPLHKILFNRPGAVASLKRNIRQFNGFSFEAYSEPYNKKRDVMKRLTLAGLRNICTILNLETRGNHDVIVDRILTFLLNPKTRERPLPKKRKRASSSKSKAIIIDSSSDDDVEHGDKGWGSAPKSREMVDDDDSSSNDVDEIKVTIDGDKQGDEDDATVKMDPTRKTSTKQKASGAKKALAKKLSAVKKRPASRKTPGGKKKMESIKAVTLRQKSKAKVTKAAEEEISAASDLSDNDSEQQETAKSAKKRAAPTTVKPAAKTKKADSSSSSSKMTSGKSKGSDMEVDSSDNEPLIKLLKKPPTDEQLKETIGRLLKDANLEEVTMKQMYKKVFESYPEYDLTGRKDFIKETVKKFIS